MQQRQRHKGCCANLFSGYTFQDLVTAKPPKEKGVYVIRIKKRSDILPEAMIVDTKKIDCKSGMENVGEESGKSH